MRYRLISTVISVILSDSFDINLPLPTNGPFRTRIRPRWCWGFILHNWWLHYAILHLRIHGQRTRGDMWLTTVLFSPSTRARRFNGWIRRLASANQLEALSYLCLIHFCWHAAAALSGVSDFVTPGSRLCCVRRVAHSNGHASIAGAAVRSPHEL